MDPVHENYKVELLDNKKSLYKILSLASNKKNNNSVQSLGLCQEDIKRGLNTFPAEIIQYTLFT